MASPDDAIDVDVPPSPRIKRGKGDANEPLELASSDSEDESPVRARQMSASENDGGGVKE